MKKLAALILILISSSAMADSHKIVDDLNKDAKPDLLEILIGGPDQLLLRVTLTGAKTTKLAGVDIIEDVVTEIRRITNANSETYSIILDDYDSDDDRDIACTYMMNEKFDRGVLVSGNQPNTLYFQNDGQGHFTEISLAEWENPKNPKKLITEKIPVPK